MNYVHPLSYKYIYIKVPNQIKDLSPLYKERRSKSPMSKRWDFFYQKGIVPFSLVNDFNFLIGFPFYF